MQLRHKSLLAAMILGLITTPSWAGLEKLSNAIGDKVSVNKAEAKKITDVIIDMETEKIAYLTLTKFNVKDAIVVPAADVKVEKDKATFAGSAESLADAPPAPDRGRLSAKDMAKVDKHFGHKPYWKRADQAGREPEPRLRMGRNILNIQVVDDAKNKLGEVSDVALSWQDRTVPYVVIKDAKNGRMHAVPLAAFEKSDDKNHLMLKVPRDVFHKGATFAPDEAWPTSIDRAWIEYVQVRYGRPGVQAEGAAEKNASANKK